jgi:DNA polymerase-3 subunit beta
LRLVATDLEFIGLEASLEASVRDSGAVTLPARLFTEAIGSLSAPQVELRADERNTVEVVGGTAQYSIRGLPAEDFEMLPDLLDPTTFSLSQVELSRVITQTVFATSTDDTRPNLTGALVQMCPEHLEVVATDTHRLAWRRVEVATGLEEPRSAIVSARALHELDRALEKDSQEPARLSFSDTQVQAVAAGITVGSRLIEGQFPSYQKVIPEQHERRVTLSGAAFL